jgi:hypothetical protein
MSVTAKKLPLLTENPPQAWLDELLNPAKAGRELPGGRGTSCASPSYIVRKINSGDLQFVKVGRRLFTTRRYLRAMIAGEAAEFSQRKRISHRPCVRTVTAGDRAADAAQSRLASIGK